MRVYLYVFLLMVFSLACKAQLGTFPSGSARTLSVANITVTQLGVEGLYGNPAGLAALEKSAFDAGFSQRYNLAELSTISIAGGIATKLGNFGIVLNRFGFDEYNENKFGLAYARKLSKDIHIGAMFDMIQVNTIDFGSTTKFTYELGVQSKVSDKVMLCASAFSPGNTIVAPNMDEIPSVLAFGFSYIAGKKVTLLAEVSKPSGVSVSARAGLIYNPIERFSLRGGVDFTNSSMHFGPAFEFGNMVVTGAYGWDNRLGSTLAVSVGYGLTQVSSMQAIRPLDY